jgi:NAD(P)H dehydrogenase (quinone)
MISMKHALIVAHPNEASFTMAMAHAYADAAAARNDTVLLRDLYRMAFDPCLHADELPWAVDYKPRADIVAERELLESADVFVFVYPFWFNAPPAILKGYVDRVFSMGFGFDATPPGAKPLLIGKRLISVTSSGAPKHWVDQSGALDAERRLFDEHIAAICGMRVIDHLHFGRVTPGIREDAVGICAAAVRAAVARITPST